MGVGKKILEGLGLKTMKFLCRNYVPFRIHGSHGTRVLPVYIHILKEYLEWANALNLDEMLRSLSSIVINNLEDIERKAKVENTSKANFSRVGFNDQFVLAYAILNDFPSHTLMISSNNSTDSFQQMKTTSFGLTMWIFPPNVGLSLSIDEIVGAEIV